MQFTSGQNLSIIDVLKMKNQEKAFWVIWNISTPCVYFHVAFLYIIFVGKELFIHQPWYLHSSTMNHVASYIDNSFSGFYG